MYSFITANSPVENILHNIMTISKQQFILITFSRDQYAKILCEYLFRGPYSVV